MTGIDIATGLGTALVTQASGPPGDGPGWWILIPIGWLLVVVGVVSIIVINVRRRGRLSGRHAGERVLAERYAAGEITDDEYRARLATLREPSKA